MHFMNGRSFFAGPAAEQAVLLGNAGLLPKQARPDMDFFRRHTPLHEVGWPAPGKE